MMIFSLDNLYLLTQIYVIVNLFVCPSTSPQRRRIYEIFCKQQWATASIKSKQVCQFCVLLVLCTATQEQRSNTSSTVIALTNFNKLLQNCHKLRLPVRLSSAHFKLTMGILDGRFPRKLEEPQLQKTFPRTAELRTRNEQKQI